MTDPSHTRYKVLITGGYGFFGGRLAARLARDPLLDVVLAGPDAAAATRLADTLNAQTASTRFAALALDLADAGLAAAIRDSGANLLIHTGGPFQWQGYHVAEACIACGVHYIDLADGRDFVLGIGALDAQARAAGVLVVSGASSVPALSGAVIDALAPDFKQVQSIDIGISPGNRTVATMRAILAYTGAPLRQWRCGRWKRRYGWQDLRQVRYPQPAGRRWLANCDVPDLTLWQQSFPGVRNVRFGAGLQLPILPVGQWLAAIAHRAGLVRRASDVGAMHVQLDGLRADRAPISRRWTLLAARGDGPFIPTLASAILAGKLARGALPRRGATACSGMLTLDDFYDAMGGLAISMEINKG